MNYPKTCCYDKVLPPERLRASTVLATRWALAILRRAKSGLREKRCLYFQLIPNLGKQYFSFEASLSTIF
jgi:hypothetical protein